MSSLIEFPGEVCYCGSYGFFDKQSGYLLDPKSGWWVHSFCRRPARWVISRCIRCNSRFVPKIAEFDSYKRLLSSCPECEPLLLAESKMLTRYNDIPRLKRADGRTDVNISNSEVSSFLKCERRHYYGFRLGLVPKTMSKSMTKGTIAHEGLAVYYHKIQQNESTGDAKQAALDHIKMLAMQDFANMDLYADVTGLLDRYFDWCLSQDTFTVLAVERLYYMPMGEDHQFAMRLDLLVQYTSGPYAGEIVLIDHKTVYDFWPPAAITLNAQMPKYMGAVRYNKIPVRRIMINQIRTRVNKGPMEDADKFRRVFSTIDSKEVTAVLREQQIAGERIIELNALTEEQHERKILRAMDRFTCENCPFANLCKSDLTGQDTTLMKQVEFQRQEDQPEFMQYGYNPKVESDATSPG
jgi:hypothetical protein